MSNRINRFSLTTPTRRLLIAVLVALSLLLLSFSWQGNDAQALDADINGVPVGTFVARVYYQDSADIETFIQRGLDVYEYNNLAEKYVLAGITPDVYYDMQTEGWQLEVDQIATTSMQYTFANEANSSSTFYGGYRTVTEIYNILDSTNAANPTITELVDYGDSYCKLSGGCSINSNAFAGYDLRAIRLGNENNAAAPMGFGQRPVFFLMAAIHSRELTTAEQALFYLDYLTSNYGTDADVTWLIDWHDIYIVPVANPDGRYVVETINTPASQRKNANETNGSCNGIFTGWGSETGQPGIDLNRNHSFGWNTGGSSGAACNLTYRGINASSETEVSSLEAFITSVIPDQRGPNITDAAPDDTLGLLVTMHSYSDLVLRPWGNSTNPPPNATGLAAIGDKLGIMTGYQSCQVAVCLYTASGGSDDWSYGELGIPSFTYEIGGNFDGFFPNYTTASTTHWAEVGESLEYAARIARTPYMLAEGPDVDVLAALATTDPQLFNVTANIYDGDNGNQNVAAAVMQIDTPYWATGATTYTLSVVDGAFDTNLEAVEGLINICSLGLADGDHTLWVRGQDANGNWGPVWADTFTVNGFASCTPTAVTVSQVAIGNNQFNLPLLAASGLMLITALAVWVQHKNSIPLKK